MLATFPIVRISQGMQADFAFSTANFNGSLSEYRKSSRIFAGPHRSMSPTRLHLHTPHQSAHTTLTPAHRYSANSLTDRSPQPPAHHADRTHAYTDSLARPHSRTHVHAHRLAASTSTPAQCLEHDSYSSSEKRYFLV